MVKVFKGLFTFSHFNMRRPVIGKMLIIRIFWMEGRSSSSLGDEYLMSQMCKSYKGHCTVQNWWQNNQNLFLRKMLHQLQIKWQPRSKSSTQTCISIIFRIHLALKTNFVPCFFCDNHSLLFSKISSSFPTSLGSISFISFKINLDLKERFKSNVWRKICF